MQSLQKFLSALLMLAAASAWAVPARAEAPARAETAVELTVAGGVLSVHFAPGELALGRDRILDWITRSARAIEIYYGRFPLETASVLIVPVAGKGVKGGKAFGENGGYIRVSLGRESDAQDLLDDWVMVHEMIHLAFPRIDDRHDWLTEGLAVYVESVARLQAGDLDEAFVWRGFVRGMEHGLPQAGDRGLDFTPTWGRTYWGGAIFCLIADLEIRKRTGGAKSLQDALRGVLAAGGDFETYWPIRKALAAGDAATGTTVLGDLYDAWRATPVDPKLPELWDALGVGVNGRTVTFDDTATLAETRKEIGRRPAN